MANYKATYKRFNGVSWDEYYFKTTADMVEGIDAIVTGKQDKLVAGENITIDENNVISASGGGGGITTSTVNIPFTEVISETQTTIEVTYSYVGDDPVNLTADFSNFNFAGILYLVIDGQGIPASMAVESIFGKTTLNYFEIIILFRYLITAILGGIIDLDPPSDANAVFGYITRDYMSPEYFPDIFQGINDVNINGATFTVDFMTQNQDLELPFYNTITGRGSNMGVTVKTVGDLDGVDGSTIDGMTLKLFPKIKMAPNYNIDGSGGSGGDVSIWRYE